MERRLVRSDVKRCQSIQYHPDYFLFSTKCIQSCAKQNGSLFEYQDIKFFISQMVCLTDEKVLLEDGKHFYHIINLKSGEVFASRKMRRDVIETDRFAVSPDGKTAYRIWLRGRKYELVVIDLLNLNFQICAYPARLNGVADLIFHKDKGLQVLETQVNEDGTCQNLVASIRIRNGACVSTPAFSWEGRHTGKYFDGRYVWENGYMIRDLDTGEYFSLLENSEIRVPEKHAPLAYTYYPEDKYLQIIDTQQNFFIDCKKRKIIARYFTDPKSGSYQGVLAEREFLIGYADGIYSMPFPTIEMQTV